MAFLKWGNNYSNNNGGNKWKKAKDGYFHGGSKPRSHHNYSTKKSSFVNGQQLSPYQLEDRFCAAVGGISLKSVIERQRYMYQDEKILQWKDSAAEEAFTNAKIRFFAEIHGEPCDVELPDPDIFVDKVDWNSKVDPKLMVGLDKGESGILDTEEHDSGVVVGIPEVLLQSELTPSGWGDAEEVKPPQDDNDVGNKNQFENGVKSYQVTPTGWGDDEVVKPPQDDDFGNNHQCDNGVRSDWPTGWEGDYVYVTRDMGWNEENKVFGSDYVDRGYASAWKNGDREQDRYVEQQQHHAYGKPLEYGYSNQWDNGYSNQWDNGYNGNKDHSGWGASRYKISRFQRTNQSSGYHAARNGKFSRDPSLSTWKPRY